MIDSEAVAYFKHKNIVFMHVNSNGKRFTSTGKVVDTFEKSMLIEHKGMTQAYSLDSISMIREIQIQERGF